VRGERGKGKYKYKKPSKREKGAAFLFFF